MGRVLAATFAHDLAPGAKISASNVRGQDPQFATEQLVDGRPDTYWATDDATRSAEVVLE
jgi:alpha-L-fucosidase